MKYLQSIVVFAVLFWGINLAGCAQEFTGIWYNEEKDAKIKIYQDDNGDYTGKIVWLKNPTENGEPRLDEKNNDKDLRDRELIGLQILSGFEKKGKKLKGGEIYDPKSGKTYSCKIKPKGDDTLKVRGYVGVSLLGRTDIWTKAAD